jgi:tetratricopeptide (TPR) repeat protein
LFLHLDDPAQAHSLLVTNSATKTDPWLIAAEIAISELAEQKPRFYKQGVAIIDDGGLLPRHITELAGAVGTAEMIGGNRKKARRMFGFSMVDPTGNALAQAEWASPGFGSDLVPPARFGSVEEAFEANAFHRYREGKYHDVISLCRGWSNEEPYSIRPFEFGASTAGLIEEFDEAHELATQGLSIRPGAPKLVNAGAFALASLGKTVEAEVLLRQMSPDADERNLLIAKANRGLISFRAGAIDQGKQLYGEAIEGFQRLGEQYLSASARVYFAREAAKAKIPEAVSLFSEAVKASKRFEGTGVRMVLARVEKAFQQSSIKNPAETSSTGKDRR